MKGKGSIGNALEPFHSLYKACLKNPTPEAVEELLGLIHTHSLLIIGGMQQDIADKHPEVFAEFYSRQQTMPILHGVSPLRQDAQEKLIKASSLGSALPLKRKRKETNERFEAINKIKYCFELIQSHKAEDAGKPFDLLEGSPLLRMPESLRDKIRTLPELSEDSIDQWKDAICDFVWFGVKIISLNDWIRYSCEGNCPADRAFAMGCWVLFTTAHESHATHRAEGRKRESRNKLEATPTDTDAAGIAETKKLQKGDKIESRTPTRSDLKAALKKEIGYLLKSFVK